MRGRRAVRGATDPESRGATDPELRGPADPELRGSTDPESRGPADPELRGPADPELPDSTDAEFRGSETPYATARSRIWPKSTQWYSMGNPAQRRTGIGGFRCQMIARHRNRTR